MTTCDNSAVEKADLEEKTEEVACEKGVDEVKTSKLGETDDIHLDESQVKEFEDDGIDKDKAIEDSMEIGRVVTEEGKPDNAEIVEREEVLDETEDVTINVTGGVDERATDDRKNKCDEEVHQHENHNKSGEDSVKENESKRQGDKDGDVEDHNVRDDNESSEEPVNEKGSKKHPRVKVSSSKKSSHPQQHAREDNEEKSKTPQEKKKGLQPASEETKTPTAYSAARPVRERKSVERLVASIEDYGKEFHVEKGRGTALKDIPNVAYKMAKKKTEETFKLLHNILFGRRGKAAQLKTNISRFSGFVWHDNEEKQLANVKEKFDKCVKEKLVEFCDVLDIPISKVHTIKEDLITKLTEFLLEPHAMTSELIADKEQSNKSKKRKRSSNANGESSPASKGSSKRQNKSSSSKLSRDDKSRQIASDDESEEEGDEIGGHDTNGVIEKSENDFPEESESDDSDSKESPINETKKSSGASKMPSKEKPAQKKAFTKKETIARKISPPSKKTPAKSPSSKTKKSREKTPKVSFGQKKGTPIQKPSTPKQSTKEESTGKKIMKAKEKIEEKLKPTDDELKNAVCEILEEVDFNTATFTDILAMLAKQFSSDLTSRNAKIMLMMQDELTKLAEAEEEEEEGDVDEEEDKPSTKDVEA